jgi:hypothetical protein
MASSGFSTAVTFPSSEPSSLPRIEMPSVPRRIHRSQLLVVELALARGVLRKCLPSLQPILPCLIKVFLSQEFLLIRVFAVPGKFALGGDCSPDVPAAPRASPLRMTKPGAARSQPGSAIPRRYGAGCRGAPNRDSWITASIESSSGRDCGREPPRAQCFVKIEHAA